MYVDPNGHIVFFLITMLIGLAVGTGVALYNDYSDDNSINGSIGVSGYVAPIVIGGAIGATVGMAISGALTGSFFSGVKGVFTGAKMVYGMYKAVGIAGAGYMMLDNLSNAMYYTPHTFWSGGDIAKDSALEYSMMNGTTTLEMTRLGNYLESLSTYNEAAWRIASANFVNQVPEYSTIHAILYYPDMRTNSIWLTEELVELAKKFVEISIGK